MKKFTIGICLLSLTIFPTLTACETEPATNEVVKPPNQLQQAESTKEVTPSIETTSPSNESKTAPAETIKASNRQPGSSTPKVDVAKPVQTTAVIPKPSTNQNATPPPTNTTQVQTKARGNESGAQNSEGTKRGGSQGPSYILEIAEKYAPEMVEPFNQVLKSRKAGGNTTPRGSQGGKKGSQSGAEAIVNWNQQLEEAVASNDPERIKNTLKQIWMQMQQTNE